MVRKKTPTPGWNGSRDDAVRPISDRGQRPARVYGCAHAFCGS
jgi:hypothetical protein